MPRTSTSDEIKVVQFFRTAPLEVAKITMSFAKDTLSNRIADEEKNRQAVHKAKVAEAIKEGKAKAARKGAKGAKHAPVTSAAPTTLAAPIKQKGKPGRKPKAAQGFDNTANLRDGDPPPFEAFDNDEPGDLES